MFRISAAIFASWIVWVGCKTGVAFGQTSPASRATIGERDRFIALHRCAIETRLLGIHRTGPRDTSRDRFLAVSLAGETQSYVQCIFFESDTKMYCEASSGFYRFQIGDGLRLQRPEASIASLRRLGFVGTGTEGNFHQEIDVGRPVDVSKAADSMLGALYDAYDARPGAVIQFTAPKASDAGQACAPTS